MISAGRPTSSLHAMHTRNAPSVLPPLNAGYHSIRQVSLAPLELDSSSPMQSSQPAAAAKPMISILPQNKLAKPLAAPMFLAQNRAASKQDQLTRKSVGLPALRPVNPRSQPFLGPLASQNTSLHAAVLGPLQNNLIENIGLKENSFESGPKIVRIVPYEKAPRPLTPPPLNPLEFEPPTFISLASEKNYTKLAGKMPKLPVLPSIKDPDFAAILKEKIKVSNVIFEFKSDTNGLTEDQDVKSRALCELVQFFEQSAEARKLPEDLQAGIFSIIQKNIFEQVPVYPDVLVSNNYFVPVIETTWPHLFYCYQILNRFVQLFPESPLLTLDIAKSAMRLLNLPDNNERLQLLAFLRSYYDLHNEHRQEIVKYTTQILVEYREKQLPPYAIPPLLVFSAHIFTRNGKNVNTQFLTLLRNGVFPLIKSPHIHVFLQHLVQLLTSVFSDGSPVGDEFMKYIFQNWETPDSKVKAAHIEILIFTGSKLGPGTMSKYSKRIFSLLAKEMLSVHLRVVLAALSLWLRPKLDEYIENDSKYAVSIMYENVKRISELHWSPLIKEKASQTLAEMGKLNRNQFLKMRNQKGTSDQRRKRYDIEHQAMKNWAHIAKDIYEFTDNKIDIKPKLIEIKTYFDFKIQDAASIAIFQKPAYASNK